MKFISSLLFLLVCILTANAQVVVTSINENFDLSCSTTGPNYPTGWTEWNTIPPVSALAWNCQPLGGRWGTGGMECTSFYGGVNYKDTAWLFTPEIDLTAYTGKVFMRFDTRYEFIAAKLSVLTSHDNTYSPGRNPDTSGVDWSNMATSTTPVIDPTRDSAVWITRQVDLTPLKSTHFYTAFRFTSSASAGGTWAIDNIYTTTFPLGVSDLGHELLPVTVIGTSTGNQINFTFSVPSARTYKISIVDILGREVYVENLDARAGIQQHSITGLDLRSGMYVVKVANEYTYGVAKTIVE